MSRLTRDGTVEPVSLDQVLRCERGQGNIHFPCSADHVQDRQPYPVNLYSAIRDDHTYIHTYMFQLVGIDCSDDTTVIHLDYGCSVRGCCGSDLSIRGALLLDTAP